MPELPEVETVKETLKKQVKNKKIKAVFVYHQNTIENISAEKFISKLKGEEIHTITRRGKWLIFELDHYFLLSHLRMEGKYFMRTVEDPKLTHELVRFDFYDGSSLRYHDTRKFGKMYLLLESELYDKKPLCDLGLEPWDPALTPLYLKEKYKNKKIPIKQSLLDQSIITGIGNIYADEILYLSHIHPLKKCNCLTLENCDNIIENTQTVLSHAIELGGTTVRSFTSSEGVHGLFQNELFVHEQKKCPTCHQSITKIKVGGRGTYYCENCQREEV